MLMPSLRCPLPRRLSERGGGSLAVTLLTEDIDLADSLGAGVGRNPTLA